MVNLLSRFNSMTHLMIQNEILNKFRQLYNDPGLTREGTHPPYYSKLMSFKKKLAQLSLEELQVIQKKLKSFDLINLRPQNYLENVQKLRRLKKYIQDDPRNQYKHLIPALNLFSIERLPTVAPYYDNIFYLILASANTLADGDMNNPEAFCRSFEEKLCLLNEAGCFSFMQSCKKNDNFYLSMLMLCLIIPTGYISMVIFAFLHLNIYYLLALSLPMFVAFCVVIDFTFNIIPMIYAMIDFKINFGKLSDFLLKISFDEQVSKWALMSLEKKNKLPKDVLAHIGSFFPNHKDLEKRLYPEKINAPIPEHKGLTSQPVMIN
jgi:ribosomal protein L29